VCQERAYALAQQYGFDPAASSNQQQQQPKKVDSQDSSDSASTNRFTKARDLFRRVPTLNALFWEVISFQSLNSILSVAFVSALKQTIPNDIARSSYSGQFYSLINAVSAAIQFLVLPWVMTKTQPMYIWRAMPLIPVVVCLIQETRSDYSLSLLSAAFFLSKTMDYSVRGVVYPMVYQVRTYSF
jgi:ATP/ADP translocase